MIDLLTISQAAAELEISIRRMQQLVQSGRVKHQRVGRAIVIRPKDLDAVRTRRTGRPQKEKTHAQRRQS
jgi:excisionase family DNA binding protein